MIQRAGKSLLTHNQLKCFILATSQICSISTYSHKPLKSKINHKPVAWFASDHKYSQKTTKQIEKQIAMQKWKQLQNTFKSLNSRFSLNKPTASELQKTKYSKPDKYEYNLQNLRELSHSHPVYLYWEMEKDGSPMNQVINKVLDNLWKAEQKETLQFLQFLYAWQYKKVDPLNLYQAVINRFDLNMGQLFKFMKRFDGKLFSTIEVKVLERLNKENLASNQYGDLLRIVNYFTVKNLLSDQFYYAVTNMVSQNINKIPPSEALQAYVYYTYNINEHITQIQKEGDQAKDQKQKEDLGVNIVKVIEKRLLSPECLKFYNGEQLVALLHTFLKNNLILVDESKREQYQTNIDKIVNRVQLGYYSQDFTTKNKQSLLQICGLLPEVKKQTIIALVQHELLKKSDKFDCQILPSLYLISFQNNMLTEQIQTKIQNGIIESIFQLDKKDISRVLWLMTLNRAKNLQSMYKKIQTVIEGGLNGFRIQDITIIVWSMCASDFNQEGKFWDNIQSYIYEELQRQAIKKQNSDKNGENVKKQGDSTKSSLTELTKAKLTNQCSWVLWAYHNNRPLGLQLVDLISSIIINEYDPEKADLNQSMKPFQLTSIISYYYSVNFPEKTIVDQIKKICLTQFKYLYPTMEPIQLCKCLKYIGQEVWKQKQLAQGILDIFELEAEKIPYRDIITVVGILISSQIKTKRVTILITKLMERKKRLESLEDMGSKPVPLEQPKQKTGKWKFTL